MASSSQTPLVRYTFREHSHGGSPLSFKFTQPPNIPPPLVPTDPEPKELPFPQTVSVIPETRPPPLYCYTFPDLAGSGSVPPPIEFKFEQSYSIQQSHPPTLLPSPPSPPNPPPPSTKTPKKKLALLPLVEIPCRLVSHTSVDEQNIVATFLETVDHCAQDLCPTQLTDRYKRRVPKDILLPDCTLFWFNLTVCSIQVPVGLYYSYRASKFIGYPFIAWKHLHSGLLKQFQHADSKKAIHPFLDVLLYSYRVPYGIHKVNLIGPRLVHTREIQPSTTTTHNVPIYMSGRLITAAGHHLLLPFIPATPQENPVDQWLYLFAKHLGLLYLNLPILDVFSYPSDYTAATAYTKKHESSRFFKRWILPRLDRDNLCSKLSNIDHCSNPSHGMLVFDLDLEKTPENLLYIPAPETEFVENWATETDDSWSSTTESTLDPPPSVLSREWSLDDTSMTHTDETGSMGTASDMAHQPRLFSASGFDLYPKHERNEEDERMDKQHQHLDQGPCVKYPFLLDQESTWMDL